MSHNTADRRKAIKSFIIRLCLTVQERTGIIVRVQQSLFCIRSKRNPFNALMKSVLCFRRRENPPNHERDEEEKVRPPDAERVRDVFLEEEPIVIEVNGKEVTGVHDLYGDK